MNDTLGTRTPNLSADIHHRINTSNKNKKLESTKVTEITYSKTGGGITGKFDAITFELFLYACEIYYKNSQDILDFSKTAATDNVGNNVQITYSITDTSKKSFTINAYITKCTLLINGKNSKRFELCDITKIHSIMSDTKISGVKINIEKGNRKLAEQLEEAIATLQSGLGLANTSNSQTGVVQNINQGERCHKCNRNCRTKAVLCIYGHWVHYNCEKFSEDDVKNVKRKDFTYVCTVCTLEKVKNNNIVKALEANDKQDITLAESLLQEENVLNCHACDMSILNKVDCCSICLMKFHSTCLNTTNHTCFACLGLKDQSDIVHCPTQHTEKNEETLTTSSTLSSCSNNNNSTAQDQNETSANSEFQKIKMKELRQLEQRLRKKDEQLKLKETAINENMSEKTKVLDRLFKAEARNLELEQTVKTLFTRIETLEAYKTTQGNGGTFHSIPNTENKVSHDSTSSDKLIVGIRDKVTNYVLGKVDEELNKLLNNSCNRSSNSEQFNPSQQSFHQQKSFMQPHQYSPNQHSNQPYVTTQRPNHQFSSYDQPVFHNTSHVLPSHQYSNAYYQYDHIQNREQDIEINHSVNFHLTSTMIETYNILTCGPLFDELKDSIDIYLLQEHWLFHCQLKMLNDILLDYKGVGKAVDSSDPITPWRMPRGYGGTAILWKKNLDSIVTPLSIGNNRIQCIEINGDPNLIVISVYLPCKGSTNSQTEFQECIDLLNEILTTYELTHQIIIGGDFNEEIFGSNDSIRQKYIVSFMDEHCLSTKDIGKTFISANGSDCTAIDYILFQETFKESIINIKKCEFTGNVSDHYPLLLSLDFEITKSSNTKTEFNPKMKVKWDKADLSKYTEIINEGLITSLQDINTKVDIETGFHDITAVIAKATNEIAQKPKTRKNKPKLKVMSDEILKAIRNKKSAFYYWKAKGRPTDSLDPFLLEKKITTQELRKICRLEVAQKRIQERNEIIEARSSNKTLFYKLINKQRGKLSRRIDELNVGDNIYNTPEQIMEVGKYILDN
ncbi:unnamed protein product [Mytilus edulis]|uniref:Endonuclease/exonuclease/phosphatase domain-containing protein n=1 Tax=Mytilus edulis TaxID=6550 RepID=A0A8S3SB79_MYTED|nr:unnamed protein product [Mytilus edulis]